MDSLPDLGKLSDDELHDLIDRYVKEENEVSFRRRMLHGYIDILRSELIARKKKEYAESGGVLENINVEKLTEILAGKRPADVGDDEGDRTS